MPELTATGPDEHQRLQWALNEGEVVRIGRAPRSGWQIPWDQKISREHADLVWKAGQLTVTCLETARNPISFRGEQSKELVVSPGNVFQIGDTNFEVTDNATVGLDSFREYAFRRDDLEHVAFGDPAHQMQIISRLPRLIATSPTDEDFAQNLIDLLLEGIPRAAVAAVVRYDEFAAIERDKPAMLRWDSRTNVGRFMPSRRLIRAALTQNCSLLHIWKQDEGESQKYTASGNLDWAVCTPLAGEACKGWCIYVSGESAFVIADPLKSDVRFTELLGQFISSIRQVRQLQEREAAMSHYFSPAAFETLRKEDREAFLAPKPRDISVLFCDIRGFSKLTEESSNELLGLLERVKQALGIMTRAIVKYEGVIADFQGDAALGFWGWPVAQIEGPESACLAALEIRECFSAVAGTAHDSMASFQVGIGISHGPAIAGTIGSEEQSKVGVFGPVVNRGSRLESLTKQLGVPILIDEATAKRVREQLGPDQARCRRLASMQLYGTNKPVVVSELLPPADRSEVSDEDLAQSNAAVEAFEKGDWTLAAKLFERLPEGDGPRTFFSRYLTSHDNRPPEDWNGVLVLGSK